MILDVRLNFSDHTLDDVLHNIKIYHCYSAKWKCETLQVSRIVRDQSRFSSIFFYPMLNVERPGSMCHVPENNIELSYEGS